MNFNSENKHMVDVLFVLTLFFVFALSSLTLVILGANVYRTTVDHMSNNFNTRTSYAFVTQKFRQQDNEGMVTIGEFDGHEAVILSEAVGGTLYNTYLYESDGYLCELLARADVNLGADSGSKVIKINDYSVKKINDKLYQFSIDPVEGEKVSIYISTHTSSGGGQNE